MTKAVQDPRINKHLKTWQKLTAEQVAKDREFAAQGYETAVQKGDVAKIYLRAGDLANFSRWEGGRLVVRGDAAGWEHIERYSHLSALTYALFGIKARRTAVVSAVSILHLLHLGEERIRGVSAAALAGFVGASPKEAAESPILQLALWCHRTAAGETFEASLPAPYAALTGANAVPTPEDWQAAVEYHLANSAAGEAGTDEFIAIDLIPLEVVAICRLSGVAYPPIEHALFEAPFSAIPAGPPRYVPSSDSLYRTLVEAGVGEGKLDASWRS